MRSVAVTGHRTYLLGGDSPATTGSLLGLASDWLAAEKPSEVVSGLADGWDIIVAQAALALGIPLVAALPYRSASNAHDPDLHARVLAQASEVYAHSEKKVHGCYAQRDRWVMERGSVVLALSSGAPGGTARAVVTAETLGKTVINLWDAYLTSLDPLTAALIAERIDGLAKK